MAEMQQVENVVPTTVPLETPHDKVEKHVAEMETEQAPSPKKMKHGAHLEHDANMDQAKRVLTDAFNKLEDDQQQPSSTETGGAQKEEENTPLEKMDGAAGDDVESSLKKTTTVEVLRFAKLTDQAIAPTRGSVHAAGFDLYSAYEYSVPAKGKCLVKTDVQVAVPHGCYGRVAPRSGLACKHFIDVGAGVVDSDYRGNLMVLLFNFGDVEFKVSHGDRVAQLVCERICLPELVEYPTLDETERGEGGFGSTGR